MRRRNGIQGRFGSANFMKNLCHVLTFYPLIVSVLVIGTVVRASEALSCGLTTGKSNEVQIVSRIAEEQKSFTVLWQQYKIATSSEYRRMLLLILVSRPSREISPEIDIELCNRFENSADPDTALLLGMCVSSSSHRLLSTREKMLSQELSKTVRLALARRGDVKAESAFIEEFLCQPVGRGEQVNWRTDQKARESIGNLEYIGSLRCILALFDATVLIKGRETTTTSGAPAPDAAMAVSMKDFLSRIEVTMPGQSNKQEVVDWWKENRAKVINRINEKGSDLPRLKPIRIVLPYG